MPGILGARRRHGRRLQARPLPTEGHPVLVDAGHVVDHPDAHLLRGDAFDLEEPAVAVQPLLARLGPQRLDTFRTQVVGRQGEGATFPLGQPRTGEEFPPQLRQIAGGGLDVVVGGMQVAHPDAARRPRGDLQQPCPGAW